MNWRRWIGAALCAGALAVSAVERASPRVEIEFDRNWRSQVAESADKPDDGLWLVRHEPLFRSLESHAGRYKNHPKKPSRPCKEYTAGWYEFTAAVPAAGELGNRRVRFVTRSSVMGDMTLYVNGKKAGELRYPLGGEIDVTGLVRPGGKNIFHVYMDKDLKKLTAPGRYRTSLAWQFGFMESPYLTIVPPTRVKDVFANTSVRAKKLILETEIDAAKPADAVLQADIADATGKIVKTLRAPAKLKAGLNTVKPEIPWSDPIFWEIGKPYLYTCRTRLLTQSGATLDEYPAFTFGFREFWRDGKELMLNGHIQRLRTVYSYRATADGGAQFLRDIGFNTLLYGHIHLAYPYSAELEKNAGGLDKLGMACLMPGSPIGRHEQLLQNPAYAKQYEAVLKATMRKFRNHPSVIGFYLGVNTACPTENMKPEMLGQYHEKTVQGKAIDMGAALCRKYNPNVIAYSHADGNSGDLSSNNLYLNFTPLQEREEWLSQWSKKGIFPWHGAEWGQPYHGNFWQKRNYVFMEHMARFFGDRVYATEPEANLRNTMPYSEKAGLHGYESGGIYEDNPIYWEFSKLITGRTNRAWRGWGINGGVIHFNLMRSFGTPTGPKVYSLWKYGAMKTVVSGKPAWANPDYDNYQIGNHDFCGSLGGYPMHTDKTHAFTAGEKVEKQCVFAWDGAGAKTVRAEWRAVRSADGKTVASGAFSHDLKTGDIRFDKIVFTAPKVAEKTAFTLNAVYTSEGKTVDRDEFAFEVYPVKKTAAVAASGETAVFDPSGKAEAILRAAGIPFRALAANQAPGGAKFLIYGKNALDKTNFPFDKSAVANGLNVLILAQNPGAWQSLGFDVHDGMARTMFLRDTTNPAFAGIANDMLAYWRGAPDYGAPYGNLMAHRSTRGPRWTRNHTVAGLTLRTPGKAGFLPLVDGEFDLNYAGLLQWKYGKGSITFCTLDLEDRYGTDPAAARVIDAVLKNFYTSSGSNDRPVFADGSAMKEMLQATGFATAEKPSGNSVLLIGPDSKLSWSELRKLMEGGANTVVSANDRIAREAGFTMTPKSLYRVKAPRPEGAFRACGSNLFRWRDAVKASVFTKAPAGFTLNAEGLAAEGNIGKGRVVFFQIDPYQLCDRYRGKSPRHFTAMPPALEKLQGDAFKRYVTDLSTNHLLQLYARMLTNLGARSSALLADRMLYLPGIGRYVPLKSYHVLGAFQAKTDDSKVMLDTKFPGEDMAIAGDYNPNPRFDLPQGGQTDWRPSISADEDGFVNLRALFPDTPRAVTYLICELNRETDQPEAVLNFGVDWRAKIWCNGKPVFRTDSGSKGYLFSTRLKNLKKGTNVLTFKIGSGLYGNCFWAQITPEEKPGALKRENRPELNAVRLYERNLDDWDPYRFIFW